MVLEGKGSDPVQCRSRVKRCVGQRHLAKAFGIGIRKGFGRGIWQRDLAFGIWQRHLAKAFIWQRGKGTWQRGKGIWQRRKQAFGKEARAFGKEARAFGKGGNRRHVRCSQGGDFACAHGVELHTRPRHVHVCIHRAAPATAARAPRADVLPRRGWDPWTRVARSKTMSRFQYLNPKP